MRWLYKKTVMYLSILLLFILCGLFYLRHTQGETMAVMYDTLDKNFTAAAAAASAPMRTFVNENVNKDQMASVVKGGDTEWLQRTILPNLRAHTADGIWVYDTSGSCVFGAIDNNESLRNELPLQRQALSKLFSGKKWNHFFVTTPEGLMEVQGASIYPSNDPGKEAEPQGYLFAGKMWSPEYTHSLAQAFDGALILAPTGVHRFRSEGASVIFSKPLLGWEGKPVMFARLKMPAPMVGKVDAALARQFAAIGVLAALFLAAAYVFLRLWIGKPLTLIIGALATEDASFVKTLINDEGEFGSISCLLVRAFEKKKRLEAETLAVRKEIDAQKKESEQLSSNLNEFSSEIVSLREKYKSDLEHRAKNAAVFGSGNFELLQIAYDDLDRKFQEQRTKLYVVSELLQREIIKSHEHYKAEMIAAFQREQALKELNRMTEELGQQKPDDQAPIMDVVKEISTLTTDSFEQSESHSEDQKDAASKKPKNRRKTLGTNLPKINYTEAQC